MELKDLLGDETQSLLGHECRAITRDRLHLPGPGFVDRVLAGSDRRPPVLRNLQHVFDTGRLAGTGYLSILPVDQGVEHRDLARLHLAGQISVQRLIAKVEQLVVSADDAAVYLDPPSAPSTASTTNGAPDGVALTANWQHYSTKPA